MSPAAFILLRILNAGGSHSRAALLRALQTSSNDELNACVDALRANGVAVRTDVQGYTLSERVDLLDTELLATRLQECGSRVRVTVHDECASTNASLLARANEEIHAQAIVCELQSAGRGRRGNAWHSGLADSLTFSLGWRIALPVHALGGLSLAVAVACVHSLEALDISDITVKWPNDLMRGGAKLGGILIEIARSEPHYTDMVIGIGLNIRVRDALQTTISQPIADLTAAGCASPSRNLLVTSMLRELEVVLKQFERDGFRAFKSEWLRRHAFEGRRVRLAISEHESIEGLANGVGDDGALLVLTENGQRSFHGGDVTLREAA